MSKPTFASFRLVQAQASIFTPGLQFQTNEVLAYFLTQWSELFTGVPSVLPLTSENPPEIPRIILSSGDAQYRLQISPTRSDLFRASQDPSEPLELADFLRKAASVFDGYLDTTRGVAGRLACVLSRVVPDPAPGRTLASHFCREEWLRGPLNRPSEFELHAHKQFKLGGQFQINSWMRCKTAFISSARDATSERSPVILVEQDFNTLVEEGLYSQYAKEEIARFYELVPAEFDHVLRLYFPLEGNNA